MGTLAADHLRLRLRPIHRALRAAVERQSGKIAELARPGARALCITADHAARLLGEADALLDEPEESEPVAMTADELQAENELRLYAEGQRLPLDQLVHELALTDFETEALLICAAPELDRCYERLFAYIADDLHCRFPTVDLLASLTAASLDERLRRRLVLGSRARLRRAGLLLPQGEAQTELRQELRIAPFVFEFLTGSGANPTELLREPSAFRKPDRVLLPPGADRSAIAQAVELLRTGGARAVGIWGAPQDGVDEIVAAVLGELELPARRLSAPELAGPEALLRSRVKEEFLSALVEQAILVIDCDAIAGPDYAAAREALADAMPTSTVPTILCGRTAWRPTRLLESAEYIEIEAGPIPQADRRSLWLSVAPELAPDQADGLATRFRMTGAQMRAAARMVRTQARLQGGAKPSGLADRFDAACAAVVRTRISQFTKLVQPKRGPEDLVLPQELHGQVMEVASFFLASPRVYEEWGFGRLLSGGGLKALFTGESGTGKTLAAEVIAAKLGLPLLKADLARLVSKWVGETEKNLETVFHEAEQSNAVLFIDEAEALLGRRGEVKQGIDRFANLEVSYLLQRIEEYYGLAILASNLKDQVDPAFLRRFQIVLNFPLPGEPERLKIWQLAFAEGAPAGDDVDFPALSRVEMSGAAIMNSACTAALLSVEDGAPAAGMRHLVRAIARQFQRESRIFNTAQLGKYETLLRH